MRRLKWLAVLAALLLVAGCGGSDSGGGGGGSSPPGFVIDGGDVVTTATEACYGCHAEAADGGSVPASVPHTALVSAAATDTGNIPTINSVEIIEQAEITAVTVVADSSGSLNDTYFTFSSADDATDYYVWYNVNSAGTDPAPGGTGIEVAIATGAAADVVSAATETAIDGSAAAGDVTTIDDGVDEVEITNILDGPATDAADGTAATGFDFDVTTKGGDAVLIDVDVTEEDGTTAVTLLENGDFRFTFAQLVEDTTGGGGNYNWESYVSNSSGVATYEKGSGGGTFTEVGTGNYTYSLSGGYDIVTDTDTHRVSIQVGSGIANSWVDWVPNDDGYAVGTPVTNPRDIVTTDGCNMCHAELGDATIAGGLAMHGSGRRDVEYCVTCHNPGAWDTDTGNTVDMKVMIHKIHRGKNLPSVQAGGTYQIIGYGNSVHDYSKGAFPQPVNNCDKCHDGADGANWSALPTQEACGSCHDTTSWAATTPSGMVKHAYGSTMFPTGNSQTNNANCTSCHPATGSDTAVENVHPFAQAATLALDYTYLIDSAVFDSATDQVTVNFRVTDAGASGANMDLTAGAWAVGSGASRLYMTVAWKPKGAADYTNPGAGSTSAPGAPLSFNLLCGGTCTDYTVTNTGGEVYALVADLPSGATGLGLATMEGHPAETIGASAERLAVPNALQEFEITAGTASETRRVVVDADKCDNCHGDVAGAGGTVALHGGNRVLQGTLNGAAGVAGVSACVICHNSANTDVDRRQGVAASDDGKAEQSIDFKTMIHGIHRGRDSEAGSIEVWGYGGSQHIFAGEFPPGNRFENCENCHVSGFLNEMPLAGGAHMEGITVDSGDDVSDHDDDLNMSPNIGTCSACHDKEGELVHMQVMGGNLSVLEEDIMFY